MTNLKFANSDVEANLNTIKKAKNVLRAINHKLRENLLVFIDSKGKVKVTDIHTSLNIEQSVASQHLSILRNADLVKTERDGKCIYYSVNYERIQQVDLISKSLVG